MRVLNCLSRSHLGGANWRVAFVARILASRQVETIVLFPDNGDLQFQTLLGTWNIPYVRLRLSQLRKPRRIIHNLRHLGTMFAQVRRIAGTIARERIDLLHVNAVTNFVPVLSAIVSAKPVVWHWNDTLTPRWFAAVMKCVAWAPHVYVAAASKTVGRKYALARMGECYLGLIEPPAIPPQDEVPAYETVQLRRDLPVIGFVGGLVEMKGVLEFVEVMARLRSEGMALRAYVVGNAPPGHGEFYDSLRRRIVQLGLDETIVFLGYRFDAAYLMTQMDVLLFPSWSEASSLVVLQALAVGLPIAATAVGDNDAILAPFGMPVMKPGDVPAMTRAVKDLLAMDRAMKDDYARRASSYVEAHHSPQAVARRHAELYERILKASGAKKSAHGHAAAAAPNAERADPDEKVYDID
jgi:glycosyltransferase involved in cell wall biosynthesis